MKLHTVPCYCALISLASALDPLLGTGFDLCAANSFGWPFDIACSKPDASSLQLPIIHGSPSKPQEVLHSSQELPHSLHDHETDAQLSWAVQPRCLKHGNETEKYCVYTSHAFASSRGISFIAGAEHSKKLLELPALTNPELLQGINAESDVRFVSKPIPGKGLGLVALRPILRGEELFRSTPVLMAEDNVYQRFGDPDRIPFYHLAIQQLPNRANKLFHELMGHFGGDPVDDKINTNCFAVELFVGENGEGVNSIAVFPEMSRMNHDCRPNSHYYFDSHTLTQHVHALRTILPGEEITISYIDPAQTSEARKTALKTSWGFPCGCQACNAHQPIRDASDKRVQEIVRIVGMLQDYSAESAITDDETGMRMADLLVELYGLEGMLGPLSEGYAYAAVEYNSARRKWDAVRFANMAIEAGLLYSGPKDPEVLSMMELVDAPEKHWSWDYRARKRWEAEQQPAAES